MLANLLLLLLPTVSGFLFPSSSLGCNCPPSPPCPVMQCPAPAPCPVPTPCQAKGEKTFEAESTGQNKVKTLNGLQDFGPTSVVDKEFEAKDRSIANADDDMDLIYEDTRTARRRPRQNYDNENSTLATAATQEAPSTTPAAPLPEAPENLKCNSKALEKLMLENIAKTTSMSKRQINKKAEEVFGGSVDVICSRGHFSYIYSSNLYCEVTNNEITCIAFRQAH